MRVTLCSPPSRHGLAVPECLAQLVRDGQPYSVCAGVLAAAGRDEETAYGRTKKLEESGNKSAVAICVELSKSSPGSN